MFVRARLEQGSQQNVFLVPQSAMSRDPRGNAQVLVVGKDGKAEARPVTALRTEGNDWVVSAGLKPGDKLITQGLGKARAGRPVKAVPEGTAQVKVKTAGETTAVGTIISWSTTASALDVQPFANVTVTA